MKRIDFENGNIVSNILKAALPMLVAQIMSLLYNIVDRVYIARIPDVGTTALGAVGLCFPIIVIITAFSNLFGTGGAPIFSIERGKGNHAKAGLLMNTSFTLLTLCAVILMIVGLLFARPILVLFGASDAGLAYAYPYLMIYLLGTFPSMAATGMNPFINAQGYATTGMISVIIGAITNLLLDPLFIFVFGLGIKGDVYISVMTIISSVRQMVETPIYAITEGSSPIISYNYGARRPQKIRQAGITMAVLALIYTLLIWSVILAAPRFLIGIFSSDQALMTDTVPAMKLYFAAFIFMLLQYVGQTIFKALNKKKYAIFFSILRKVIIVVPLTYILPYALNIGPNGVFMAEPVSNVIGGSLCFIVMLSTVLPELKRM